MLKKSLLLITIIVLFNSSILLASSPRAWDEFRADVKRKCAEGVKGYVADPEIKVSDYGTESYGVAIAEGQPKDADSTGKWLCIYDKRTKKAEFIDLGAIALRPEQKAPADDLQLKGEVTKVSADNQRLKREIAKVSADNRQLKSETTFYQIAVVLLILAGIVVVILWRRSFPKNGDS